MRKKTFSFIFIGMLFIAFLVTSWTLKQITHENEYILDKLVQYEDDTPLHYIKEIDTHQVSLGHDLIHEGWTTHAGSKSKRISKFFVCTDCHNTVKEELDLASPTPEERLKYTSERNIPFLQGTTLYGTVNRSSWYNGDYVEKYGDWIIPARDTLENAIQLCAKVCSQGRELEEWEMTAIMHYLHTIGYKMEDLIFSDAEKNLLSSNESTNDAKINTIKSKYALSSSATFMNPMPKKERNYGAQGNPENGQLIYEGSCQHCHSHSNTATSLKLDNSRLTFKLLKSRLNKDNNYSIYNIVRTGTYADVGMRAYMPHYTAEKMSDQQIEDLVSYIKEKSK